MRRRDLMILLGGVAAWPLPLSAQQAAMPTIGFLGSTAEKPSAPLVAAFRQGLNEAGYTEPKDVTIEFRWADGSPDRLPALAAELVDRKVSVIVASGGTISALAAKAATTTIPVVFTGAGDPLGSGIVANLSRPGGNVTGFSVMAKELDGKRLELLHDLVPKVKTIAVLMNPNNPIDATQTKNLQAEATVIGAQIHVLHANSEQEIDAAFASLRELRAGALVVGADPIFTGRRDQIVTLTARVSLPAIYQWREFAVAGGLISYGSNLPDAYRQAGIYVGRILKGAKPADLPVMQPTKFELVVNLKTAKALGITVPPLLLARADEVIE